MGLPTCCKVDEDEERERRRYGRGEGFGDSVGVVGDWSLSASLIGDIGSGGSSIPNSSTLSDRGGGRSTWASNN